MSGFSADWLQTREPFDAAARDPALARRFGEALGDGQHGPRRIIDLAAGSGANFRVLAPLLGGDQDWLLVDHDPLLIAAQATEIARWAAHAGWRCGNSDSGLLVETGTARWCVRTRQLDLAQDLEQLALTEADGVTTTAFLDLVSPAWLDRLADTLARANRPLLATLTVDGRRLWHPALPADARIQTAFQQHQGGDKGFGPSLGIGATAYLADRLAATGSAVQTARSDWRIGGEHREMLAQMVTESAAVAAEAAPADATLFTAWARERKAQVAAGMLTLEVGHLDLLAVPGGR
jgi:hypothetical protein